MTAVATRRQRSEARVSVRCRDCGGWGEITDRAHRNLRVSGRDFVCRDCRHMGHVRPTDRDRRYWLLTMTDQELADLASQLAQRPVTVEHVRAVWPRERLLRLRL
jgi:hypothetical protein